MDQLQTRLVKLYIGIAAFIISQAIFLFLAFPETDGFIASLVITAFFCVMFLLIRHGFNWARWVLMVLMFLFAAVFILAAVTDDDYGWMAVGVGYLITIAMLFKMGRLSAQATGGDNQEQNEDQKREALNTGSFTSDGIEYTYPQLVTRIKALYIDGMIILAFMVATMVLMDDSENRVAAVVTVWLLGVLFYEPILTVYSGTIGQRMMHIRVRRFSDPSKKIGIVQAYGRVLAKSIFGWLSFLTINFNPQHRAIHDFAGKSVMVNESNSTPTKNVKH